MFFMGFFLAYQLFYLSYVLNIFYKVVEFSMSHRHFQSLLPIVVQKLVSVAPTFCLIKKGPLV